MNNEDESKLKFALKRLLGSASKSPYIFGSVWVAILSILMVMLPTARDEVLIGAGFSMGAMVAVLCGAFCHFLASLMSRGSKNADNRATEPTK